MTLYSKITVQEYLIFNALFVLQVSHWPAELEFIVIKLLPEKTIPLQTSHFTAVSEIPFPCLNSLIQSMETFYLLSLQWFTKLTVLHELTDFCEYPG
jgi:hypothetical protein